MSPAIRLPRYSAPARTQSGVVLMIALIVLVAMTMAAIALFRQASAGILIAGNLAFKQSSTYGTDRGVEEGRAWLLLQSADFLSNDAATQGYYSSWSSGFDPTNYGWTDANSFKVTADDGLGNEVRYVIHRLCAAANLAVNASTQQCVTVSSSGAGASKGGVSAGNFSLTTTIQPYFRITVRTYFAPRNTVSYTQTIMY